MANDVYQLNVIGIAESQLWESVLHFQSGVANATNPLTAANHLITAFSGGPASDLTGCMGDDASITGYKAKRVNNTGGPQALQPITPVPGSFGSDCSVASNNAVILSYYVQGTKTRAGRWFLPALPTAAYDDGTFSTPFKTAVAALITAINASITSGGDTFHWGVWARKTTTFFTPSPVILSGHLGTQRRRLTPVM